jgi:hypothetical protein
MRTRQYFKDLLNEPNGEITKFYATCIIDNIYDSISSFLDAEIKEQDNLLENCGIDTKKTIEILEYMKKELDK